MTYAAFWSSPRRTARGELRARSVETCRGLLSCSLRRYAGFVHRDHRVAAATMVKGAEPRLDHRRIWHAAALHRRAHAPRSGGRQAIRPYPGDSEAYRALP